MVTDFEEMAKPEDWIIVTYEDRNGDKHEEKWMYPSVLRRSITKIWKS